MKKTKKMNRLLIFCMTCVFTSCVSLEKQFIKNPIESAELCMMYFPTKILEEKEVVSFKSDTVYISGDSIECKPEIIIKDSLIQGKKIPYPVYLPSKAKCPDSMKINNEKESKKETVIKDTSCEVILKDREFEIEKLSNKIESKNSQLFWLYLILGLYISFKLIRAYFKSKTKNIL